VYTSILNVKREKGKSLGGVLPIGLFRDAGKGGSCEMKQSQIFSSGSPKKLTSVFMLIVFAMVVGIGTPVVSFAAEEESSPSNEAALGVGSFFLSLVYSPVKMAYAILGGIVGGLTYGVTGGDLEIAQVVWESSMYGTYIITPDHLKGNEPVRFVGVSPYEEEAYVTERVD
jgi:hypothetical protein